MAQVDFAERQVTLKVVYYGPPLSGKTSNLKKLHEKVDVLNRGRLMTLDTRDDRTLFFDLLPIFFRTSGFSFRIKVYTVPGQPSHEATRRVVLTGADGVVFVADSSPTQQAQNAEAWKNLLRNLAAHALEIPIVVQLNKRDLPDACRLEAAPYEPGCAALVPAAAVSGDGVLETFSAIALQVWGHLDKELQLAQKFGISREVFAQAVAEQISSAGLP